MCLPSLIIFSLLPRMCIVIMDHDDFFLNVLVPHILTWDFHVALPKWPDSDPGNTITNPLSIYWCSLYMVASPSRPAGNRFSCISHFCTSPLCYIVPLISHFLVDKSHLFADKSHFLLMYDRIFALYRKNTLFSLTPEQVKRLYNTVISHKTLLYNPKTAI